MLNPEKCLRVVTRKDMCTLFRILKVLCEIYNEKVFVNIAHC